MESGFGGARVGQNQPKKPVNGGALIAQGPICYQSRDLEFEAARAINPALIKEPHFAYQREWRALWAPRAQPIAPVLVTSPEAARLCRRVAPPG